MCNFTLLKNFAALREPRYFGIIRSTFFGDSTNDEILAEISNKFCGVL